MVAFVVVYTNQVSVDKNMVAQQRVGHDALMQQNRFIIRLTTDCHWLKLYLFAN
jgi:hypothetical protein